MSDGRDEPPVDSTAETLASGPSGGVVELEPAPGKRCPDCGRLFDGGVRFCPDDGTALTDATTPYDSMEQRLIAGRYRVRERLGSGAFGAIYAATQEPLDRPVALKLLHRRHADDPDIARRFLREARAVSRLRNPHTVRIFDFGTDEVGQLYLAMELIDGPTLADVIAAEAPLPPARVVRLADHIAESLAEAHHEGIVHRDLKPSNIMLDRLVGHDDFARVLDFGIARLAESDGSRLTASDSLIGTPQYMAPEQWSGGVGPRTDLYALGAVLYELSTGRPPFTGRTPMELMYAHTQRPPPPLPPSVPPRLAGLIEALLAKNPDRRPADAAEVRARLAGALEVPAAMADTLDARRGWPVEAGGAVEPAPASGRGRGWLLLAGAAALGAAWWVVGGDGIGGSEVASRGMGSPIAADAMAAPAPDPDAAGDALVDAAVDATVDATADAAIDATVDAIVDAMPPDAAPAPPKPRPVPPRHPAVKVVSDPPGAAITVDGRALGRTPGVVRLPPGTAIILEREGYFPARVRVPAKGGEVRAVLDLRL